MSRGLNDEEIAKLLQEGEEVMDSASENEQEIDVIVSDHNTKSEQSAYESEHEWGSEDEVPFQYLFRPAQRNEGSSFQLEETGLQNGVSSLIIQEK